MYRSNSSRVVNSNHAHSDTRKQYVPNVVCSTSFTQSKSISFRVNMRCVCVRNVAVSHKKRACRSATSTHAFVLPTHFIYLFMYMRRNIQKFIHLSIQCLIFSGTPFGRLLHAFPILVPSTDESHAHAQDVVVVWISTII